MKLLGWTIGQWSTVEKKYPFDVDLVSVGDFADARMRWNKLNLGDPEECLEICPVVEFGLLMIHDLLPTVRDENLDALDKAHNKAVKPIDAHGFYRGVYIS